MLPAPRGHPGTSVVFTQRTSGLCAIQLQGLRGPQACPEEEDSRRPALEMPGTPGWECPALPERRPAGVAPAQSWGQSLLLEAEVTELVGSMLEWWPSMTLGKLLHFSEPQFAYL